MSRLDRNDGDIDTLIARIAHIRTWTYIAHRSDWLAEAASWQERARAIEDRLSDALHDRLTQRFVDRRGALLARQLASPGELLAAVKASGEVLVEGHFVGRLDGFRFQPDAEAGGEEVKRLLAAANRVLRGEIATRARRLAASRDNSFRLAPDGMVLWLDGAVGRLLPGDSALAPRVEPLPGEFLEGDLREMVRRRLARFLRDEIHRRLAPLFRAQQAELSGPARGLIYQLTEALGSVPAASIAPQRLALDRADRQGLARLGIRLGTEFVYLDRLLKPDAVAMRALLWSVQNGAALPPAMPEPGRLAAPREGRSAEFCAAIGYFLLGAYAVRVDRVERLAAAARRLARQGAFAATPDLAAAAGVSIDDLTGDPADARLPRHRPGERRHLRREKRPPPDPQRQIPEAAAAPDDDRAGRRQSVRQAAGVAPRAMKEPRPDLAVGGRDDARRQMAVVRPPRQEPLARRTALHRGCGGRQRPDRREAQPLGPRRRRRRGAAGPPHPYRSHRRTRHPSRPCPGGTRSLRDGSAVAAHRVRGTALGDAARRR